MSLQILPLIMEVAPLVLGGLSVAISFRSIVNRFKAEEIVLKEIEIHKSEFEQEYLKYLNADGDSEKEKELEELRKQIMALLKNIESDKGDLIASALFQSSQRGRDSYLKNLLSEARIGQKPSESGA